MTNKELFISENQQDWKAKGDLIREMREAAGINVSQMAKYLGISASRINRFENGHPVNDAKLIEAAYRHVIEKLHLKKKIKEVKNHLVDITRFY